IVEVILLIVGPYLAVGVRIGRRHHRSLRRGRNPFLRKGEYRDLVRPAIDLGDGGLIHHRQPDIAVGVELEVEAAFRLLGPHHRDPRIGRRNRSTKPSPSLSTMTSWGSAPLRGRSYSVMRTSVARPVGRGSLLNRYSIASELPGLTLARNSAAALAASPVTAGRSPRGPGSSGCGCVGVLPGK